MGNSVSEIVKSNVIYGNQTKCIYQWVCFNALSIKCMCVVVFYTNLFLLLSIRRAHFHLNLLYFPASDTSFFTTELVLLLELHCMCLIVCVFFDYFRIIESKESNLKKVCVCVIDVV